VHLSVPFVFAPPLVFPPFGEAVRTLVAPRGWNSPQGRGPGHETHDSERKDSHSA
jgi:hypothetical protein